MTDDTSEPDLQRIVEEIAPGESAELLSTIEDLVRQFAHTTVSDGVPAYTTGGLSALEGAFDVLGWNDPHPVPEMACDDPSCNQWASCGIPTESGYRRVCGTHYSELAAART